MDLGRKLALVMMLFSIAILSSCGGGGGSSSNPIGTGGSGGSGGSGGNGGGSGGGNFTAPTTKTAWVYLGAKVDAGADNESPVRYIVYDNTHDQVFVSITNLNVVKVFDGATHALKTTLAIPVSFGMDLSADGSTLYVGTGTQFLYVVDTATLKIRQVIDTATILQGGFSSLSPITLSDGRLMVEPGGGVDGSSALVVWSPATGSASVFPASGSVYAWGAITRSGDHSKVLIAGTTTGSPISIFDVATNQFITTPLTSYIIERVASNPIKDQFAVSDLNGNISIYDGSFHLTGSIRIEPVGQIGGQRLNGMMFSRDGSKLFCFVDSTIQQYDTTSFVQQGVMAQPYSLGIFAEPYPFDQDTRGLLLGVNEDALDIIDISPIGKNGLTTVPYGYGYNLGYLNPNHGALAGGTTSSTPISYGAQFTLPTNLTAYIGQRSVSNLSVSASALNFTTPPGASAGPADLIVQLQDGTAFLAPSAFSYGPSVLRLTTSAGNTAGGGTGFLAGYGFGSASNVNVTVGGQSAKVTNLTNYLSAADQPFPTPVQALWFSIPPGADGKKDVVITTGEGSATVAGGFQYIGPMNLHTLTASLQAGTYDSKRKQIYFTDKSQIQVFSVSSGSWLSPIAVPQAVTAQLVGISLSNDGSVLAVGDQGNGAILTLNPDAPASSIRAFSAPNGSFGLVPGGLAVSNQGVVYFLIGFNYAAYGGRCQSSLFWKLDSTTGAFTDLSSSSSWCDDRQNRVLLSSDQSTVYIDADGQLKVYFPSSGTLAEVPEPNYGQSDMALSSDGSRLVQQDGVYSDTGAGLGELAWSEIDLSDSQNPTWGQKVDQAGGILLQPWSNALDLMDLSHFILRKRIALPNTVTNAFDPLVFDEDNDHAYLIVSGGVLEVPLAPLPIVLDRLNPSSGAAGSTVTLIGSGFTTDTTAEVDGTSTPVSFIDEHKMSMTLPSHALGSSRITLHRGDGDSSYLDVAFTYSSGTAPLSTRFEMKPVTKQASRITTTKSKPRQ